MEKFRELGLDGEILKGIADLGFETPSPVQEKAIPVILGEENDLVVLAQTGTGKTAAFGLPLLQKINPEWNSVQILGTEVDGDEVFINVMDAALHPDAGYHPEYHKLYADLQIDITGGEGWGYTNEPGEEVGEYTVDCGFQDMF